MSATVGAALKKILVSLLTDPKVMKTVVGIILGIVFIAVLPVLTLQGLFSGALEVDVDSLKERIVENLSEEQVELLSQIESTATQIEEKMLEAERNTRQTQAAQVLYLLVLFEYSGEDGFVEKLVGCFAEDQTDAELIANINAVFGTDIDASDFTQLMTSIHKEIVDVALSQVGNVDGEPYWSWYGFSSRIEWCACFVSWCANECGYIDAGIIPKFASCAVGVNWFKARGLWQENDYLPSPGDIIFFDWDGEGGQNGAPDHVGIVEKVKNGYVYTVEGNSGNECRQNRYAVGYYEIFGYGTPLYEGSEVESEGVF